MEAFFSCFLLLCYSSNRYTESQRHRSLRRTIHKFCRKPLELFFPSTEPGSMFVCVENKEAFNTSTHHHPSIAIYTMFVPQPAEEPEETSLVKRKLTRRIEKSLCCCWETKRPCAFPGSSSFAATGGAASQPLTSRADSAFLHSNQRWWWSNQHQSRVIATKKSAKNRVWPVQFILQIVECY